MTSVDAATLAAMSRDEKRAFVKRLKEERKQLFTELGIEEEHKAADDESKATPVAKPVAKPPPPLFVHAFRCLGLVLNVSLDSERSGGEDSGEGAAKGEVLATKGKGDVLATKGKEVAGPAAKKEAAVAKRIVSK